MGERGYSVKDIPQLGDMKKIVHVRFVAFMVECSNCAAFPSGQYVIKRYVIVKLCNSLEEHTRKNVQMSTLVRNFAKQFLDALSKFEGFTYEKVFCFNAKENEVVTIEKNICGSFFKYIDNTGDILLEGSPQDVVKKAERFVHFIYIT